MLGQALPVSGNRQGRLLLLIRVSPLDLLGRQVHLLSRQLPGQVKPSFL